MSEKVDYESIFYAALGDSTGAGVGARSGKGYVARLFERIEHVRPGSRLLNLCVSGAETADVLRDQIPRLTRSAVARPTLFTLGIGINDIGHDVLLETFAANYNEIVRRMKETAPDAPIVLSNIPDIAHAPALPAYMREAVAARIAEFNAHIQTVAEQEDVRLVDVHAKGVEVISQRPDFFSADGFHPSDVGYEFWAETMWGAIAEAMGARASRS